jgi:Transcription factor Iwr1
MFKKVSGFQVELHRIFWPFATPATGMSLPPERISVKRRRQEDPVEALYLQEGRASTHDQKRRFTDYYFKLLRTDATATPSPKRTVSQAPKRSSGSSPAVNSAGIPVVRATAPGAEAEDFRRLRAAQLARRQEETPTEQIKHGEASGDDKQRPSIKSEPVSPGILGGARRFHLARSLSSFDNPQHPSAGMGKARNQLCPPLATFVERQSALPTDHVTPTESPIDRDSVSRHEDAAALPETKPQNLDNSPLAGTPNMEARSPVAKSLPATERSGTSITDDPSTWDIQSDQLADELAALAMEMEPVPHATSSAKKAPFGPHPPSPSIEDVEMLDSDFIFETYVRVPHAVFGDAAYGAEWIDANFGVLVIGEEDEELWQQYMEKDDESDWDEEDSNGQ